MLKSILPLLAGALPLTNAYPSSISDLPGHEWVPPGTDDLRGPCPALNTLANHGYLPRSGKNITASEFQSGIETVYNIEPLAAALLANSAFTIIQGFAGIATLDDSQTMSLRDLAAHNGLEHDASLTRLDYSQTGDDYTFQPDLFQKLLDDSPDSDYLSPASLIKSRVRREAESAALGNPPLSLRGTAAAYLEAAVLLVVMNHMRNSSVELDGQWLAPKSAVTTWFTEQRLPDGWTKPDYAIGFGNIGEVAGIVLAGTKTHEAINWANAFFM